MINVIYQDENFIVVDKPSGVIVHPWSECSDKVSLMHLLKEQTGKWIYPIHRLDRAVSGVMIFAFSSQSAKLLQDQWGRDETEKIYCGLVRGAVDSPTYIDYPLKNKKKATGEKQEAMTKLWPQGSNEFVSLLKIKIETGRYHQIRRHCSAMACQLIGDTKYGKGEMNRYYREHFDLHRLFLHCLGLKIELGGVQHKFFAPLPEDLLQVLSRLDFIAPDSDSTFTHDNKNLTRFSRMKS